MLQFLSKEDAKKLLEAMGPYDFITVYGVDLKKLTKLAEDHEWAEEVIDSECYVGGWLFKYDDDAYEVASYCSTNPAINKEEAIQYILENNGEVLTTESEIYDFLMKEGYID